MIPHSFSGRDSSSRALTYIFGAFWHNPANVTVLSWTPCLNLVRLLHSPWSLGRNVGGRSCILRIGKSPPAFCMRDADAHGGPAACSSSCWGRRQASAWCGRAACASVCPYLVQGSGKL